MKEILINLIEAKKAKVKNKAFISRYFKPAIQIINKVYETQYDEFTKIKILFLYFKDNDIFFDIGIILEEILYVRKLYNEN